MDTANIPANLLRRACAQCAAITPYEPVLYESSDGPRDLAAHIPHYCPACTAAREEAEIEATRQAVRDRRTKTWEKSVPKKYRETDITHPDFQKHHWQTLKTHDINASIGLIGPAGRGKTRLLALIAKRAIANDLRLGWCPANSFQWAATREFDKEDGTEARRWLRTWHNAEVLILDDLGKHRWTDCVESAFFGLLEARAGRKVPTHWSMNPDPSDIQSLARLINDDQAGLLNRALDPEGKAAARPRFAPIVSRLLDETTIIPVL